MLNRIMKTLGVFLVLFVFLSTSVQADIDNTSHSNTNTSVRSTVLIFSSTGPDDVGATCAGDDQSVCICTGKCEAGDTCKCLKPNPFDDLPPPPSSTTPSTSCRTNNVSFVAQVIKTLGREEKACFEKSGNSYCISKDSIDPQPIRVGDNLLPDQELFVCSEINNSLGNCRPSTQAYHCIGEAGAGGGCRCSSVEDCLVMIEKKSGCKNGSCGDCAIEGQCCCEY